MKRRINDTWLWQILAILGSALSMLSIGILLLHFNGRPIFDWNGVTLNAIIAIFSVISKSMLAYTLSECLGQTKWIWISSQQRPLIDFDLIDSGSRGPLGSFKILTQPAARSFISVGAIVVTLSVVTDPFVQLTVGKKDSVRFENNSNVQIAYAKRHRQELLVVSDDIVGASQADSGMRSAVFDGLFQSDLWISQQTQRSCSSGNCTWDNFTSLAICSRCNDVTNQIKKKNVTFQFSPPLNLPPLNLPPLNQTISETVRLYWHLPNGLMIADDVQMGAWGTQNATQTVSFTSIHALIWSMTIMNLTRDEEPTIGDTVFTRREEPTISDSVSAIECGLWYCVNTYQSAVRNGVLTEIMQPTASKVQPDSYQPIRSAKGGFKRIFPPRELNTNLPAATDPITTVTNRFYANLYVRRTDLQLGEGFNISQAAYISLVDLLRETFTNPTNLTDPTSNMTLPLSPRLNSTVAFPSDYKQNARVLRLNASIGLSGYSPLAMKDLYHSRDLEATFATLAKSITNNIRQASKSDNHTVIHGKQGNHVVLIRIRPWFLTLPVTLVFGGAVFLTLVLYHTRMSEMEFWGTNTLPIVNLGGRIGSSIFDDNDMKVSTMAQRAKQHLVYFPTFQTPRDLDRVDTISQSENHEMMSPPPSRISADVESIAASPLRISLIVPSSSPHVEGIAVPPSRTSLVGQIPSPDVSSITSNDA